jgi:hypothetical protein
MIQVEAVGLTSVNVQLQSYVRQFTDVIAVDGDCSAGKVGWTWNYQGQWGVFRACLVPYEQVQHHQAIPEPAQGVIPCINEIEVPQVLRRTRFHVGSTMLSIWERNLHEIGGYEVFLIADPQHDGPKFWPKKGYLDPRPRIARWGTPDYMFKEIINGNY